MNPGKKALCFLVILALCLNTVFFCAQDAIVERARILTDGCGRIFYQYAATTPDEITCAAGWDGDRLHLVFFDLAGERLSKWDATLPEDVTGGPIAGVYPAGVDSAFVGIYSADCQELSVFLLREKGDGERLVVQECPGEPSQQRRAWTRLYSFSENDGEVRFAIYSDGQLTGYAWDGAEGVRILAREEIDGVRSAAVLPDRSLAAGGNGTLTLNGSLGTGIPDGQRVVYLTQTGTGLYYVDAITLQLYYSDLTGSAVRRVLDLGEIARGHGVSSVSVTERGNALLLLDGHYLYLVQKEAAIDLTPALYHSQDSSLWFLILCAVLSLIAAWILWYVVCGFLRKDRLPMLAQGGAALLAVALLAGQGVYWGCLVPEAERQDLKHCQSLTDTMVRMILDSGSGKDLNAGRAVARALENGGWVREVSVVLVRQESEDGFWVDSYGDRGELTLAFHASLAEESVENGDAVLLDPDGEVLRYARTWGEWTACVRLLRVPDRSLPVWQSVAAALGVVAVAAELLVFALWRCVRKLTRAAEHLTDDRPLPGTLRLRTGDELEGMASTLDSLSESLIRQEQERERLAAAYRRFVPEQVLSLMGKQSILNVDKGTFAARSMAVMMTSFRFPESVYSDPENSRLLFDSVNSIIERTASIAAEKGGTVFNFAYDGYDVVMEEDCAQVISAAVAMAQEVLSFNAQREQKELPQVSFHIALDVGNVMLGVVGDNVRLEPTTISSSFYTVRSLIGLCGTLQANILCTEAIITGAQGYGSRYMGKSIQNGYPMRVYEIFSGDSYELRQSKETTVARFSEGVLALYGGETAKAKHIFLELVHKNSQDGGARYYLYLADQMEKDETRVCILEEETG